ncbi:hypothetical protein OMW55_01675 [Sphingomonas sp. BN140010]|uniref:Uncharacterized protein n=1 Tax=Sphingomonas arvum TaxID=2992113 RepID=A0ABT3JBS7_9SPHN|nr:hypothetical protein [Sphingomonas sp. BN140010]MCW3796520.1 hypothetical protein [Sphingomonas sp. BN140010]
MVQRTFSDEADDCRRFADEVECAADKAFLHRIAGEFDRLAETVRYEDDPAYYAARAAQEVSAAVKAQHPRARLAHLLMAQRYEGLVQRARQK